MHLKDRAQQISANVAELREATGDGPRTRQLLDSLFRTVHSFKAAASAAGFIEQSRTAHEFEDLLHNLRTGKITLDDEVFQVFDNTTAALLGDVTAPPKHFEEAPTHNNQDSSQLPPEFSALKEDERHRARAAMQEGANLYILETSFNATDFDERFRQLKQQLDQVAEVISASPTMEDDCVNFKVFYAAKSPKIRVKEIFDKTIVAGRQIARKLGKDVTFLVMAEEELLLDCSVCDALEDALLHLVRNAVDHGIESNGRVTLQLLTKPKIRILVTDNGRGIDPADVPLLFQPGFSTATEVSEISGRGVGLDAVKTEIEAVGGTVNVISAPGKFTSFVITLPNPSSDA